MTILYPVLLDATSTVDAVKERLAHETDSKWAVVRVEHGFDVDWYLVTVSSVSGQIENATKDTLLGAALRLESHTPLKTVQLVDASDDFKAAPRLVLDGRRVFGLIEPRLSAGPLPHDRSTRGFEVPPLPQAGPPAPQGGGEGVPAVAPGSGGEQQSVSAPVLELEAHPLIKTTPTAVRAGKPFILEIGLSKTAVQGVSGKVRGRFGAGDEKLPLGIEVVAPEFTSAKGWRHVLEIPRADPFTPRLKLSIVAPQLAPGIASRAHAITVHFSWAGAHCGTAVTRVLVHDGATEAPKAPGVPMELQPTVQVDASAPPIDLTIRIAWRDDNEATNTLDWTFVTPHDSVPLPASALSRTLSLGGPASFARRLLAEVTQNDGKDGIELLLNGTAGLIADAIPPGTWPVLRAVGQAVREKRGADAVPTVLLLTQETQIPWELAAVPDPLLDSNRPAFLTTQCVVSRWVLDSAVSSPVPPARLEVNGLAVIVGDYPPGGDFPPLPNAQAESKELCDRHAASSLTATRQNVTGVLDCTKPAMPNGGATALHFACHGEAGRADAAASSVILNDGTPISPTFFRSAPVARKNHSFVFLNACQVGAAAPTLGQYGGFAGICVRAGCAGVIAPLWSVNDVLARHIALDFYDRVFAKAAAPDGKTSVAAAMHALRQPHLAKITVKVPQPDGTEVETEQLSATPLAYVVYGHPALILNRS